MDGHKDLGSFTGTVLFPWTSGTGVNGANGNETPDIGDNMVSLGHHRKRKFSYHIKLIRNQN